MRIEADKVYKLNGDGAPVAAWVTGRPGDGRVKDVLYRFRKNNRGAWSKRPIQATLKEFKANLVGLWNESA